MASLLVASALFYLVLSPYQEATLGMPEIMDPIYIGCYQKFVSLSETCKVKSVRECWEMCIDDAHPQVAIRNGSVCHCGLANHDRISFHDCGDTCEGSDDICGGPDAFAVYAAYPAYVGCYIDKAERALSELSPKLGSVTNELCTKTCWEKKSLYAATQWGSNCFCGSSYDLYGRESKELCQNPCKGNSTYFCGGNLRNSVYSIKRLPELDLNVEDIYHCKEYSSIGICSNNGCKPGWKGKRCEILDCVAKNELCGINDCSEYKVKGRTYAECLCESRTIYHICGEKTVWI